jgi:hypothetical protein
MTVDVEFGTVINAISQLSINGMSIKDVDEIPENPEMVLPVLFLNPDDPINTIEPSFQSFGSMGAAKMDLSYTLNYLYLHAKVGSSLSLSSVLPRLISAVALIIETIFSNDVVSGAVDLANSAMQIGIITGPNGAQFHGATFSFRVLEHVQ